MSTAHMSVTFLDHEKYIVDIVTRSALPLPLDEVIPLDWQPTMYGLPVVDQIEPKSFGHNMFVRYCNKKYTSAVKRPAPLIYPYEPR